MPKNPTGRTAPEGVTPAPPETPGEAVRPMPTVKRPKPTRPDPNASEYGESARNSADRYPRSVEWGR